jgi:hypothetical protein
MDTAGESCAVRGENGKPLKTKPKAITAKIRHAGNRRA